MADRPSLDEVDQALARRERARDFWLDLGARLNLKGPALLPAHQFAGAVMDTHFWRAEVMGTLNVRAH